MHKIPFEFHGIPLTFDCELEINPAEKETRDCPGCPVEVIVMRIFHLGVEIEPDDDVWEAVNLAATTHVEEECTRGRY